MKTSLVIWAFGPMITRFVPAGYQPAHAYDAEPVAEKVHRHAAGQPAASLQWGLWEQESELTAGLDRADRARLARTGIRPIPTDRGLALFDAALAAGAPVLAAAQLDPAVLGTQARNGMLPAILRRLVRVAERQRAAAAATEASDLRRRLATLSGTERSALLTDLVRTNAAAILGFPTPDHVEVDQAFKELGFDSLTSIELRNGLSAATGLRLPTTLVFDYPTPAALAGMIDVELAIDEPTPDQSVLLELDRLEAALSVIPEDHDLNPAIPARLHAILARWEQAQKAPDGADAAARIQSASADQIIDFIDNELGRSANSVLSPQSLPEGS